MASPSSRTGRMLGNEGFGLQIDYLKPIWCSRCVHRVIDCLLGSETEVRLWVEGKVADVNLVKWGVRTAVDLGNFAEQVKSPHPRSLISILCGNFGGLFKGKSEQIMKIQKGYNLANACSDNSKSREDGANKIEVEICDRCNANSKEEENQSQLDTMAANEFLFSEPESFLQEQSLQQDSKSLVESDGIEAKAEVEEANGGAVKDAEENHSLRIN